MMNPTGANFLRNKAAVLRSDGTNYLYFVAKNDGPRQFSASIADHEAAVVKYQRGGKALQ